VTERKKRERLLIRPKPAFEAGKGKAGLEGRLWGSQWSRGPYMWSSAGMLFLANRERGDKGRPRGSERLENKRWAMERRTCYCREGSSYKWLRGKRMGQKRRRRMEVSMFETNHYEIPV